MIVNSFKKTAGYDNELTYLEKAAQDSRLRLDRLQNESRRITDLSYSVKIDIQCKERELQHLNSEVESLKRKRGDLVQQIGTFTEMIGRSHSDIHQLRDEVEALKRDC